MKKQYFILFFLITFVIFTCDYNVNDYLYQMNISRDNKSLELYDDYLEGFNLSDRNIIFKLEDSIYVRGKKFLDIDTETYKYLGNAYYQNKNKLYFLDREIRDFSKNDIIKTYYKTKTEKKMIGTSCEGDYSENFYYLEFNNEVYIDGIKEDRGILSKIFRKLQEIFF